MSTFIKATISDLEKQLKELLNPFPVISSPSFMGHVISGKKVCFQFGVSGGFRLITKSTAWIPFSVVNKLYLVSPLMSKNPGPYDAFFYPGFGKHLNNPVTNYY